MIAADSGTFIAYFSGADGSDITILELALEQRSVVLPAVVLAELLSNPRLPIPLRESLLQIPLLSVAQGFWERAGLLRAKVLSKGFKARLADSLIAQNCLDEGIALLTRDCDFRHYEKIAGLKLVG